jgi:hypothetical protein
VAGGPARAEARLEVSGVVEASEDQLQVRVSLHNAGAVPVRQVEVSGELFGLTDAAAIEAELPPDKTRSVRLRFATDSPRPGVHALLLQLDYRTGPPDTERQLHQPAFLLVALRRQALSAVSLRVPELTIDSHGTLEVGVESLDGAAHRVEVRPVLSRALALLEGSQEVEVPSTGEVSVRFTVLRGHAERGSSQGILVVARCLDGPLERSSVVTATVRVVEASGYLTRLRPLLLVLGVALLAGAVAIELARRRSPPSPPSEAGERQGPRKPPS